MASNIQPAQRWSIRSLDDEVEITIDGQYPLREGVEDEQEPQLALNSTAGSAEPDVQWVAGGAHYRRFTSRFTSQDLNDDLRPTLRQLQRLRERDELLGRAPLISVAWGDDSWQGFASRCRIRVVDKWITGLPKVLVFDLEVIQRRLEGGEAGRVPTGETQFLFLSEGLVFEELARRSTGDPLRGELIRRDNPEVAVRFERAGDYVKVVEPELLRGPVEPQSPAFIGDWQPVVEELAELRGSDASPGQAFGFLVTEEQLAAMIANLELNPA